MDNKTVEVYNLLAKHSLQEYFSAFTHILNVYQKRDFVLLSRKDLQKVGLVTRSSVKIFEELLQSLKKDEKQSSPINFGEFYMNTMLPNQEPVIIGEGNIVQEQALGSGHFGKVYKGSWQRTTLDGKPMKIPVAIKTITDGKEMSWKTEVSIFAALNQNHSNIIKFLGLLIGDKIRMVTEFAPYGSLIDRLRSKDISCVATLGQFAAQISSGMVYLHSRNLVHRDLSARNILVTGKNQVKISDFGLSKVLNETQTEWVMETSECLPMRWLAPESLLNYIFTSASDVWSFAVVLWEMFTFGDVPWSNLNNEQVKDKILSGSFLPEPRFCPDGIYEVIKMCMNHDQHARPPFHIIYQELICRQPESLEAVVPSSDAYDLNFSVGDDITCIKALGCTHLSSSSDTQYFLGQHGKNLSFGRFQLEHTRRVTYLVPYSLDEEEGEEEQEETEKIVKMAPKGLENKENVLYEPLYQVSQPAQQPLHEVNYVNMDPSQQAMGTPTPPSQQSSEVNSKTGGTAISKEVSDWKNQAKLRPYSAEVISMREDFFDLNSSPEILKSGSDSRLGFKDTKPEIQNTVNDRIARNMTALLSFNNPSVDDNKKNHNDDKNNPLFLEPEHLSSNVPLRQQPQIDYWKRTIDPLSTSSKTTSSSSENLYEEIKDQTSRSQSAGPRSQTLRPRPKGKVPIPQETIGAYRKGSLDAYAQSVKKDFDLLSQQLGSSNIASSSCGNLPERVRSLNVSTDNVHQYPAVQNTHYLQKYDSVIPISKLNNSSSSSNNKLRPPSNFLHQQQQQPVSMQPDIAAERSPDYYNDFILSDQKLNHFTYDSKASPKKTPSPTSSSTKEKSRQAAQNYTDNQWDLFEDCVKDPKKLDKNRRKSSGKRISWPKNNGETPPSVSTFSTGGSGGVSGGGVSGKEEFTDKFKKIRVIIPEASVGECLEGLRSSGNNVEGAVRYIHIIKLYRHNYGFSFEECEQLLEKHFFKYIRAEQELKIRHVKAQFKALEMVQVQDTLCLCEWDVTLTLLTIFLQHCNAFGLDEQRARSIFNENHQESVLKALEMAKIVRVAEITNKPELVCFKTLTQCHWSIERAVNHIFSS